MTAHYTGVTAGKTKFYQGRQHPSHCSASNPAYRVSTPVLKLLN